MCALLGAILCWLMLAHGNLSHAEEEAAERYEFRAEHDPNGIGKFYMGREIAHVMGYPAATWLERNEREQEERVTLMVKSLALKPGMTVADIGAGSGRISLMLAEQVGEDGKVLAVDIQQPMLNLIKKKLKRRKITNVELVKGTEKSPELEENSVDLALMVDVYHEFEFPYEMMLELSKALKPGGRVAFVEFRMEDPDVPIKLVHKMTEAQVKKEMSPPELRLDWKETISVLPWQHIVVFEKQPAGDAE
jgi:ubiquinone/menaquinone biosynthesis C-methylase UbiE